MGFELDATLERMRRYFPIQGPIKDFLHFNALAGFQHETFDKAVEHAAELYGAHAYMPLSYYRSAYKEDQISDIALNQAVDSYVAASGAKREDVFTALFEYVEVPDVNAFEHLMRRAKLNSKEALGHLVKLESKLSNPAPRYLKVRRGVEEQLGLDFDAHINPILFRIVSGYLDQGITLWQFPTQDIPFFKALRALVEQSKLPLAAFIRRNSCLAWLNLSPNEVIEALLTKIVGDRRFYEDYIRDTLIAHAGWSGMVNYLEKRPDFLLRPRKISLKELLAFKLILEWELIEGQSSEFVKLSSWVTNANNLESVNGRYQRALSWALLTLRHPEIDGSALLDGQTLSQIWHDALEGSGYRALLSAIKVHDGHKKNAQRPKASVQAIFCLDDRECSFRRHLEEIDPAIETYGWPGFFGIDFLFQSLNDASPVQLCPPVLSPRHIVKEVVEKGQELEFLKQKAQTQKTAVTFELWREASGSLFLGFLAASTLGHFSIFSMFMGLLKPQRLIKSLKSRRIDVPTELSVFRPDDDASDTERCFGFTHQEMATRVESVLRGMGLTKDFAPLIVTLAHGASSVNNPHFAAYDCAACSGKPGAPNARVLAHMANITEVRRLLFFDGIEIPKDTLFVGAFHDTTTDFVEYFDLDKLSKEQRSKVDAFIRTVDTARGRNAKERCRRFASAPLDISEEAALLEVQKRALALFEPRAELGHATCYSCVIGRRDLTRGLFLDRRAFLNSYDPFADESGKVLTQILSAAIPVCGTVNLDYYFSRIDPAKYGCGTKLSHNICGLLGVCNGIDDDLRTGLPVQMTELHDPIRLLLVIEQTPEVIAQVLRDNPGLLEWIRNKWVHIASVNPVSGEITMCGDDLHFAQIDDLASQIPARESSLACYSGLRTNLPMASIASA